MARMGRATAMAAGLLTLATGTAMAGGGCAQCYQKVVSPPVFRTVAEPIVVRPGHVVARHIPAEIGVVQEKVLLRPAQTIAHHVPPVYRTVAEKVMVEPAGKVWQVRTDAHGRTVGCWVKTPPRFAVRHREVMVHPGSVRHEVIPAEYGVRARHVITRPAQTVHEAVPPVIGVRHRTEMVAPATAQWVPLGHRGHARHY